MKKLTLIILMVLAMVISGTSAMAYEHGPDFWVNNFYDYRTYDASHPDANIQHNFGGWQIGVTVSNDAMRNQIEYVEIVGYNNDNLTSVNHIYEPDSYFWLTGNSHDYILFIGVEHLTCDRYEISMYDINGDIMYLTYYGVQTTVIDVKPGKDNPMPPLCKIKKMAMMRNGELKMKFTAPEDPNVNQIRIRIFNENNDGIWEARINPPFEIVQADGTVIPNMVKFTGIPSEYAGLPGRIEYRTNGQDGFGQNYMLRGITYFKLPQLEDVE